MTLLMKFNRIVILNGLPLCFLPAFEDTNTEHKTIIIPKHSTQASEQPYLLYIEVCFYYPIISRQRIIKAFMTKYAHFTCSPPLTFPSSCLAKHQSNDQQATKLRK